MWVVSFTPRPLYPEGKSPQYPLDGNQSRSGRGGQEKKSHHCSCRELNPGHPARSTAPILAELSQLLLLYWLPSNYIFKIFADLTKEGQYVKLIPNMAVWRLPLLFRIPEVPSSSLDLETVGKAGVAHSVRWQRYGLDDRGSITGRGTDFVTSPPRPGRLWGPPRPLTNEYRGLLSRG
jgi:hypothetical protein